MTKRQKVDKLCYILVRRPITQVRKICNEVIDLHKLFRLVMKKNGMENVTKEKLWTSVSHELLGGKHTAEIANHLHLL